MLVHANFGVKMLLVLGYCSLGGSFKLVPKPSFVPPALQILAVVAALLYLAVGDEWGSVWCWLASCLVLLYLAEPELLARVGVLHPEALIDESHWSWDSCRWYLHYPFALIGCANSNIT